MKKIAILSIISLFVSCNVLEKEHKIKEAFRFYLNETLQNPNSLEEDNWHFEGYYLFKRSDTTYLDSPLVIDFDETFKFNKKNGEVVLIKLDYRAENGYGALRKTEIYGRYFRGSGIIQIEDDIYSFELKSFFEENPSHNPKEDYFFIKYFSKYEGLKSTYDFYDEYPVFQ